MENVREFERILYVRLQQASTEKNWPPLGACKILGTGPS